MQQFSIKTMERLSGIKAHTLRIWEQRYGILKPMRMVGNHRYYSNEDLKTLLRVVFLYEKGYRIGEIARFSEIEIKNLLDLELQKGDFAGVNILAIVEAVMELEEEKMDRIFDRVTRQYGFAGAFLEVVFPLLNYIGLLWMSDKMAPVQEHFASNFIIRKTLMAKNDVECNKLPKEGKVMMFTPKGEFHEIGLLFMNYLLCLNGFRAVYLGANVDIDTIELYYKKNRPTHLFVYLTGNLQEEEPREYLQLLVRQYPEAVVVACGIVARELLDIPGCRILRKKEEMLQFSKQLVG